MKVLITGVQGFLGQNLKVHLIEQKKYEILEFHHQMPTEMLDSLVLEADFIYHLAGVNRPKTEEEFETGNVGLTEYLLQAISKTGKRIPVVFSSSTQAEIDNPYGRSKKYAEDLLIGHKCVFPIIFRLTNVFGKWSRPNYNSVVATFCHNIANDLPISIHDAKAPLHLVYVDDVVARFLSVLERFVETGKSPDEIFHQILPVYSTTVGEVATWLKSFKESRTSLITEEVGSGLLRALHATYISFLRPGQFSYSLPKYEDARGIFVEMLKTKSAGQFSFFTAHPGVTRGGHYHHTKTEKFLVMKGKALYRFRHILTKEFYDVIVDAENGPVVMETIPGWSHDITNIGKEDILVMLWANEIFDRNRPDTVTYEV